MQDLRYTLRSLVRQPMLLIAAVVSIAVAVGANTTIFSLANELMFAIPSASRPDQLVHIQMGGGSHVSHRQWRHLEESGALAGLTGFNIEVSVNWQATGSERQPESDAASPPTSSTSSACRWRWAAASPPAKRRPNSIPQSP